MTQEEKNFAGDTSFPIRLYSKGDLAMLYCPEYAISTAIRNLSVWIKKNEELWAALMEAGYNPYRRCFMPREVALIVKYLGEPG